MTTASPDTVSRSLAAGDLTDAFDSFRPLIEGKVVIVTGATRGIGRALALYYAKLGAHVVADGRDGALLDEVAAAGTDLPGSVAVLTGDLSASGHRAELLELADSHGPVDILVNNAGVVAEATLSEMTSEQWRYVLSINLDAVFEITQLVGKRSMLPRGSGKVVNLSSILGTTAMMGHANYCASKGGIEQLTRCLALEWSGKGVHVNAIAPGYFKTRMNHEYRNDDVVRDSMLAMIPAGRFGELEDVVGPTLFLSTFLSDYCHGAILVVDGGYLCR